MTAITALLTLVALLTAGATAGPRVLGRLAPTLARRPRLGIAGWTASVLVWLLGLLALGPLVAWLATGPSLPGAAGAVCRRCLAATTPFATSAGSLGPLPPAVPLIATAALGVGVVAALGVTVHRRRLTARTHLAHLATTAERRTVGGQRVWLVPSAEPAAYAIPRAGVVLSRGTVRSLTDDQLGAVLAHENAHLRGRHHHVLAVLTALRRILGVVPLVRDARDAVAAYAEMEADDAALRRFGSRALAGALLALHRPDVAPVASALHAAHSHVPSRMERMVGPPARPARLMGTVAAGYLLAMTTAVLLVTTPAVAALAQGAC